MKKHLMSWMTIMLMAFVCVGFAACGSDDDDNGGNGSSSSSGVTVNSKYGYYHKNSSRSWEFYFSSHDLNNLGSVKGTFDMVIIGLVIDNGSDDIPVGEFTGCFEVDIAKGMTVSDEDSGTYYESGSRSNTTGKLTIKKNGSSYTFSYSGVNLYADDSDKAAVTNASFSYTGNMYDYPLYDYGD